MKASKKSVLLQTGSCALAAMICLTTETIGVCADSTAGGSSGKEASAPISAGQASRTTEDTGRPPRAPDFRAVRQQRPSTASTGSTTRVNRAAMIDRQKDAGAPIPANRPFSLNASASASLPGESQPPWQGRAVDQIGQSSAAMIDTPPPVSLKASRSVTPDQFRLWLTKTHPRFCLQLNKLSKYSVVAVKGRWDNSAKTLSAFGIPHVRVSARALEEMPLDTVKVLIIDCPGKIPSSACQRLRDFVAKGGYLLTTDWSLKFTLERVFPGYVRYDGRGQKRTVYDASVVHPDPVLNAGTVTNALWKMDDSCQLLQVVKPEAVRVLVRSKMLGAEDREGGGVLAVTFPFGRGRILHLVGHFDNNGILPSTLPDPAPIIGISLRQAIAGNFVVAGLSGQKIP